MSSTRIVRDRIGIEFIFFIVAGTLAVLTDFIIYWCLQFVLLYNVAKALSFLSGSVLAFLINKFYTFQQKEKNMIEIIHFAILYGATLFVNVTVNHLTIILLNTLWFTELFSHQTVLILAFLFATATSSLLNFLGQKFWVFNKSKNHGKDIINCNSLL